jgi:hypothetical protein
MNFALRAAVWLSLGIQLLASAAAAGEVGTEPQKSLTEDQPPPAWSRWGVELGTGALFSNVRVSHLDGYSLLPIELTLTRSFGRVGSGSALEGNAEALVRGYHTVVLLYGTESRLDGFNFGGRYNFLALGERLVPFVESTGGLAFADSRKVTIDGEDHGLGQDFNFNFTLSVGLRYAFTKRGFVRIAAICSHYSNAGLSEPERSNRQIDAVGPMFTLGFDSNCLRP